MHQPPHVRHVLPMNSAIERIEHNQCANLTRLCLANQPSLVSLFVVEVMKLKLSDPEKVVVKREVQSPSHLPSPTLPRIRSLFKPQLGFCRTARALPSRHFSSTFWERVHPTAPKSHFPDLTLPVLLSGHSGCRNLSNPLAMWVRSNHASAKQSHATATRAILHPTQPRCASRASDSLLLTDDARFFVPCSIQP